MNLNVRNFEYSPGDLYVAAIRKKNRSPNLEEEEEEANTPLVGEYGFFMTPKEAKKMTEKFFRSKGVDWNAASTQQGEKGTVFDISSDHATMLLHNLPSPENIVYPRLPRTTIVRFAVKVQALDSLEAELEAVEEDTVHKTISDAPENSDLGGIRGLDVVPQFAYGCTIVLEGYRMRFSFAEFVQGDTFKTFLKNQSRQIDILVDMFVHLERAALFMWILGFSHADFHVGNVVVDSNTKMPKIIDFGFAVGMSPTKVRELEREALKILSDNRGSKNAIARTFETYYAQNMKNTIAIRKNVNASDVKRKEWWFNPDHRLLQKFAEYLATIATSEKDLEARLSDARIRAYGTVTR